MSNSEPLKVLYDLEAMGQALDIPILKHFYRHFKPQQSKHLTAVLKNFHIRDLDIADYRSAYQGLADFLYGWDVGETATFTSKRTSILRAQPHHPTQTQTSTVSEKSSHSQSSGGSGQEKHPSIPKRPVRAIRIADEIEQQELLRLLKTFQTVASIHLRNLTKLFFDLDEKLTPAVASGSRQASAEELANKQADGATEKHEPNPDAPPANLEQPPMQTTGPAVSTTTASAPTSMAASAPLPKNAFPFPRAPPNASGDNLATPSKVPALTLSRAEFLQNSFNELYSMLDHTSEYVLFWAAICIVILALSERLGDTASYHRYLMILHGLSTDFMGGVFKQFYHVLAKDLGPEGGLHFLLAEDAKRRTEKEEKVAPIVGGGMVAMPGQRGDVHAKDVSLNDLRNMDSLQELLAKVLDMKARAQQFLASTVSVLPGSSNNLTSPENEATNRDVALGSGNRLAATAPQPVKTLTDYMKMVRSKTRLAKLHNKFGLIHDVFTAIDVHLFPTFVPAHRDTCKAIQETSYDPELIWLTGGYDCMIRIHDLNARACLSQFAGHRSIVTDVSFVPASKDTKIISGSFDRTVKLWNTQSANCERTFTGHSEAVLCCDVSMDGRYIASGSSDNSIRIWDLHTGACLNILRKHSRWVKTVRFTKDGKTLLSAGLDRRIIVWDVKEVTTPLDTKKVNPNAPSAMAAQIAAQQATSESAFTTASALAYHAETSIPCLRFMEAHRDSVLCLALNEHHPRWVLSASRDQTVRIHDFTEGFLIHSISLEPSWACTCAFAKDGKTFATGSFDNNIILFDTMTADKLRQIRVFNMGITGLAFPHSYSHIVCGSSEGHLQLIPL